MSRPIPHRHEVLEPHSMAEAQYLEAQPTAPPLRSLRNGDVDDNERRRSRSLGKMGSPWSMPPPPFTGGDVPDVAAWPVPDELPWLPSEGLHSSRNIEFAKWNASGWPTPAEVNMPDLFPFPPPFLPPPPFPQWTSGSNGENYGPNRADDFPWLAPLPNNCNRRDDEDIQKHERRSSSYCRASQEEQERLRNMAENARRQFTARSSATRSQSSTASTADDTSTAQHSFEDRQMSKIVEHHRSFTRITPQQRAALKEQREMRINSRRNSVMNVKTPSENKRTSSTTRQSNVSARYRSPTTSSSMRVPSKLNIDVRRSGAEATEQKVDRKGVNITPNRSHSKVHTPRASRGVTLSNLKGETPSLEKAMQHGLPSEQRRMEAFATKGNDKRHNQSSFVGFGATQYTPFVELARKDPRAAEYLRGIESLYSNLRSSYESFQKHPEQFLKNRGPTMHAIQNAVQSPSPARAEVHRDPSNGNLFPVNQTPPPLPIINDASPNRNVQPSAETRQLREELDRLEHQWQALSELRVGEPGVRGSTEDGPAQRLGGVNAPRELKEDIFSFENVLGFVRERKHQ